MNILDENVAVSQRRMLHRKGFPVRQIGQDIRRLGMKDDEIIPLLHQLDRPTFFTLDGDFYRRRLRHDGYCLVHLNIAEDLVAKYVRRFLRHRSLNTKAKRMGRVIRVLPGELTVRSIHEEQEVHLSWSDAKTDRSQIGFLIPAAITCPPHRISYHSY